MLYSNQIQSLGFYNFIQLFQERLSENVELYWLGNGCLIEAKGISSWQTKTVQTGVFMLFLPVTLLTSIKKQQTITTHIGIVACAFTLVWDNFCRNGCMLACQEKTAATHCSLLWNHVTTKDRYWYLFTCTQHRLLKECYSDDFKNQCMRYQYSLCLCRELWDHQGTNIASRLKEINGTKLFRHPKKRFFERQTLFRRCCIANGFGQLWHVENVRFGSINREIIFRETPLLALSRPTVTRCQEIAEKSDEVKYDVRDKKQHTCKQF